MELQESSHFHIGRDFQGCLDLVLIQLRTRLDEETPPVCKYLPCNAG